VTRRAAQYFLRVPDAQVEQLLRSLTFLPLSEIQHVMRRSETRHAQALLRIVHSVRYLFHFRFQIFNPDLAPSSEERKRHGKIVLENMITKASFMEKMYLI
jgi:hypothetical protein